MYNLLPPLLSSFPSAPCSFKFRTKFALQQSWYIAYFPSLKKTPPNPETTQKAILAGILSSACVIQLSQHELHGVHLVVMYLSILVHFKPFHVCSRITILVFSYLLLCVVLIISSLGSSNISSRIYAIFRKETQGIYFQIEIPFNLPPSQPVHKLL